MILSCHPLDRGGLSDRLSTLDTARVIHLLWVGRHDYQPFLEQHFTKSWTVIIDKCLIFSKRAVTQSAFGSSRF